MIKSFRKFHPLLKIINNSLVDIPAPQNISLWWNFGSLLGLSLVIQLISGIFLAIFYTSDVRIAFDRVVHIIRDVQYGWLLRSIHANGASIFFICLYLHISRGVYYHLFNRVETWSIGVILYIVLIATAFIGYVLPWGQIRFWGATVITRLLSAIPYIGLDLVNWVWGGFAIDNPTLTRFFALHFILPFIVCALTVIHILFLHQRGRKNPLGFKRNYSKIPIHPYYTIKDLIGFFLFFIFLSLLILYFPQILGDAENFIQANPLSTPLHIKPEWYFLWLYAILRSIPNKLGGVIAIFSAILILFLLPFLFRAKFGTFAYYPFSQVLFWILISTIFILTWIGICPVEYPYEDIGAVFTFLYFFILFINPLLMWLWDYFF